MALLANDVFVVQKTAGGEIRKVTAQALSDYLQSGDTVVYKGVGDFTDVSENPPSPNTGDLWVNNALISGTFAWLPAPGTTTTVEPGDRCIYNGASWDIIASGGGDVGVETITSTAPIEVDLADASAPNITIIPATTAVFGAVQLATDDDVTNSATNRVVTADQLKVVDDKVDAAAAGGVVKVTGADPIVVDATTSTEPAISIKDAAPTQKGAIAKFDTSTDIGGPSSNTDYTTWVGGLDDTSAITIKAAGSNFLLADFSEYEDA